MNILVSLLSLILLVYLASGAATDPDLCPDGSYPVNCFAAPCDVTTCKAHPEAICTDNYCGGCNAVFTVEGQPVECAPNCFHGQVWTDCGMPCFYTCDNYQQSIMNCVSDCVSKCQCPNHIPLLHNGRCVAEDKCSEPALPEKCILPADGGPCEALGYQWYYNYAAVRCQEFQYGCCQGNNNRYSSRDECEKECRSMMCDEVECDVACQYGFKAGPDGCDTCECWNPCQEVICRVGSECVVTTDPMGLRQTPYGECQEVKCKSGQPLVGDDGVELFCGLGLIIDECPAGSECMVHPADQWAVCCLKPKEPKCAIGIPLFNPMTGEEVFCGRGIGRMDCPERYECTIHETDRWAVCCKKPDPKCWVGEPLVDPWTGDEVFCGEGIGRQDCPDRYKCSIFEDVCCEVTSVCELPQQIGDCDPNGPQYVHVPRWYYDYDRGMCLEFTYSNCGHNANHFGLETDCEKTCIELACDEGMKVYKECGSSCTRTCDNPVIETCDDACNEGCHCPDDLPILHNGRCIKLEQCRDGKPHSCATMFCNAGQVCVLEDVVCVTEPCDPRPVCKNDPCALMDCLADYTCRPKQVQCVQPPCDLEPVCVPHRPCVLHECDPGQYCEVQKLPCPTVAPCDPVPVCVHNKPHPCATVFCRPGQVCVLEEVVCVTEPCYPQPVCSQDPCNAVDCKPEYRCVAKQVQCVKAPCDLQAVCIPRSPCGLHQCDVGQYCKLQDVQCVTASCDPVPVCVDDKPHPCATVLCDPGKICVAQEVVCARAPCLPQPLCVEDPCNFIDCPTNRPRCVTREVQCETGPCDPISECIPLPDPCESMSCDADEKCVHRDVQCEAPPCDPVPQCIKGDMNCYTCEGTGSSDALGCLVPDPTKTPQYKCHKCWTWVISLEGLKTVKRGCAMECDKTNNDGESEWCCEDNDLCNGRSMSELTSSAPSEAIASVLLLAISTCSMLLVMVLLQG